MVHRETSHPHVLESQRNGLLPLVLVTILAWLAVVGVILLFFGDHLAPP